MVASDARGPLFESSLWQTTSYNGNLFVSYQLYWKDENKDKEVGKGQIFEKTPTPVEEFKFFLAGEKTDQNSAITAAASSRWFQVLAATTSEH